MAWFDLDKEDDVEKVLNFIERLPGNLRDLFIQDSFADLLDRNKELGVTPKLFFDAFSEAENVLLEDLRRFRYLYNNDGRFKGEEVPLTLKRIGFTGRSLTLKACLLNKLWEGVINVANVAGKGIVDFAINPIVKALRKFLTYLNSMLGSLKELLPGIDAIKEIKEIGESYLAVAEI